VDARGAVDVVHGDLISIRHDKIFEAIHHLEWGDPSDLLPFRFLVTSHPPRVFGDRAVVQVDHNPTKPPGQVLSVPLAHVIVLR